MRTPQLMGRSFDRMRIVFMGTPGFAAASLERLYADGHDVACVFTKPDKPAGRRGLTVSFSPVKQAALAHGSTVYQPDSLRDDRIINELREFECDIIVVVAYGKLLHSGILNIPPLGCVNIHGSLLPKYRGAAPVQWAVLNGEAETGVTSMYMTEEIDAGDILLAERTPIGMNETAEELYERLGALGAGLLSKTLAALQRGEIVRIPQNSADVTYAPALSKDMSPVDWTKTAAQTERAVRGLTPWPIASATLGGIVFKLHAVEICENDHFRAKSSAADAPWTTISDKYKPGEVISADRNGIMVACRDGAVLIKELQAPGGKRMTAADYMRGHPDFLR